MHTFNCDCGNILPVFPGMEGRTLPCPKCGKELTVPAPAPPGPGLFGQTAIDLGFITKIQLDRTVEEQRGLAMKGKKHLLGQVMLRHRFLAPAEIRDILKAQGRLIFRCPKCGRGYNVTGLKENDAFPCGKCGAEIPGADHGDDTDVSTTYDPAVSAPAFDREEQAPPPPPPPEAPKKDDLPLQNVQEVARPEPKKAKPETRRVPVSPRARAVIRPPSSRRKVVKPEPAAEKPKQLPLPLIIGGAAAAAVLLIVIILIVAGGGEDPKKEKRRAPSSTAKKDGKKGTGTPVRRQKPAPISEDVPVPRKRSKKEPEIRLPAEIPQDFRRKIRMYVWRLNLSGVAARYLDFKAELVRGAGEKQKARTAAQDLRTNMFRLAAELRGLAAALKKEGVNPFVDDHLLADDEITYFQNEDLSRISVENAMNLLGTFVSKCRGGSRARVGMRRDGIIHEISIIFDEAPKELWSIMQGAKEPAARTPVRKKEEEPEPVPRKRKGPALSDIGDSLKRLSEDTRDALAEEFLRVGGSKKNCRDYATAAALFLSLSDADQKLTYARVRIESEVLTGTFCGRAGREEHGEFVAFSGERFSYRKDGDVFHVRLDKECVAKSFQLERHFIDPVALLLQLYFAQFDPAGMAQWTSDDHLRAATHLAGEIAALASGERPSIAGPDVLLLFAMGHLSDAVAELGAGDGAVTHAAEKLGLERTKEGKYWGPPEAAAKFAVLSLRHETPAKAASASLRYMPSSTFMLRYAAHYFALRKAVEEGEKLREIHKDCEKFRDALAGRERKHLAALAEGVENLGRCPCGDGRIPCVECRATGKKDLLCANCGGDGKLEVPGQPDAWYACSPCRGLGVLKKNARCPECRGKKSLKCSDCKSTGWYEELPDEALLTRVCAEQECGECDGRGIQFRHTTLLCEICGGFGMLLIPSSDPSATLGE
ncbi:MAG: hypothetical protein ACYTAF_11315 [Planctomycetota bacterium]|jgi:hypothetical protein